ARPLRVVELNNTKRARADRLDPSSLLTARYHHGAIVDPPSTNPHATAIGTGVRQRRHIPWLLGPILAVLQYGLLLLVGEMSNDTDQRPNAICQIEGIRIVALV